MHSEKTPAVRYDSDRYYDIIRNMTPPEHTDHPAADASYTGRAVIYRDSAISTLDVQRAADALLRQGIKPSVAAVREQLGGGSPNMLTPLLSKYWETLGQRLGAGSDSLERVPENLAGVTELLWRRALEEARERLKTLAEPDTSGSQLVSLQEQVMKLSVALAEARAREGEQLSHLASMSKEREGLRAERGSLLVLLKSTQALFAQQSARVVAFEQARKRQLLGHAETSSRARQTRRRSGRRKANGVSPKRAALKRKASNSRNCK